ncbi:hypothetical protein N5079_05335 [Planotetraspora sp. A-T 1434]|uniref:hypothetical protein n=1 Tax=Planotetraspora sp. A-T 1434 TaxID=2979219 RepID=UPI0021C09D51|nr:hypothetical protein [Planotetraspora sp. A-T 1434]MCT9929641.1 hypothetical protein [Planotetraspora sp. A-T 1434]
MSTLIAHEPVAPRLLPGAERIHHERELRELQAIYRRDGLAAVITQVARVLGIDPAGQETEPDITRHPFTPQRAPEGICGASPRAPYKGMSSRSRLLTGPQVVR